MGKVGKISVIPKEFGTSAQDTMEKSLRQRGMSRAPGTVLLRYPYKEASGKYRTGLDEDSRRIREMPNGEIKDAEIARVRALRKKLEDATGLDLSPKSAYYNHNSNQDYKVSPIALRDDDNIFNLNDPWQHITYLWAINLPDIASSLTEYQKGKFPPDTQFYVNDENLEAEIVFKKKKIANDAIIKFDSFSLNKRRKIARLLNLPIGDSDKEEVVYNRVDDYLKKETVPNGPHKGMEPIRVFSIYSNLDDDVLNVRDIITVAFNEQIYRERENGRVYEGELQVFDSKDSLIAHMISDINQRDLLDLENKINAKKLQHV